jgi:hypothetical protein
VGLQEVLEERMAFRGTRLNALALENIQYHPPSYISMILAFSGSVLHRVGDTFICLSQWRSHEPKIQSEVVS